MLRSADDWDGQHFAFRADGGVAHADSSVVSISRGPNGATATIPDAHLLFNAAFARAGSDLVLHGDGKTVVVHDYFATDKHPLLLTPDGAALTPTMVDALTGPRAPGQYAQAGAAKGGVPPIGHVVIAQGDAEIMRNGVVVTVHSGDAVLKGDVLQTGSGSMAVTLNDGTTVNLTANSRMAVNDFLFDPNGHANHEVLDLVQGSLSFISGKIAHDGGHMEIDTPVATMGIRGTAGDLDLSDGTLKITITQSSTSNDVTMSYNGIQFATLQANGTQLSLQINQGQLVSAFSNLSAEQRDKLAAQLQFMISTQELGNQINQNFFNDKNPQSIQHHTDIQFDIPQYVLGDFSNVKDIETSYSTVIVHNVNLLTNETTTFTFQQELFPSSIHTFYWTGSNNTQDWSTGGNWTAHAVPTVADDVIIGEDQNGQPVTPAVVSYSSPISVNSLLLTNGALLYASSISVVGDLSLIGSTTEIAALGDSLTFDVGGNFLNQGVIDPLLLTIKFVGGNFLNQGAIDADCGTLSIDSVVGTFVNDAAGILRAGTIDIMAGADPSVSPTLENHGLVESLGKGHGIIGINVDNSGTIEVNGLGCDDSGFGVDINGAVTNSGHLLARGGGYLGLNDGLTNTGEVKAVGGAGFFAPSEIDITGSVTNQGGTIQAGDFCDYGGRIVIKNATVDNTDGLIAAYNGGEVDLKNTTITGGTLWVDPWWTCSLIAVICAVTFDGTAQAVTIDGHGTVEVFDGAALTLQGDIQNDSTIQIDGAGGFSGDPDLIIDGSVTLTGHGVVDLGGWGAHIIGADNGGTLTNYSTITGTGMIGDGGCDLTLVNKGEISASFSDHMVINTGWQTLDNDGGTILATHGGEIEICNAVFNHDCGTIEARDGGQIGFDGSVTNSHDSLIEAKSGGAIDFSGDVHNYGTILATDCGSISFNCGWVENNGVIEAHSGGTIDIDHWVGGSGTLAIDGGTIELGSGTCNVVDFSGNCGGTLTLDHVNAFHGQIADFGYGDTIDFAQLHDVSILGYCDGALELQSCGTDFSLSFCGSDYTANNFVLTDTACGTLLTVDLHPPVAVDDNVITNIGDYRPFQIPDWVLLANDTGGNSHGDLSITNVDDASSALVDHNGGAVTFLDFYTLGDLFHNGGSFDYQVSDGLKTDTGHVTVSQDDHWNLDGTSGNDILIGKAGGTTINGNGGNDIFIGGSGNDTLNGGSGADNFVFIPSDNGHNGVTIGHDTVADFHANDFLTFDHSLFQSVDQVLADAAGDGHGNTIITADANDSVKLHNVTTDELHQYSSHILIV
jgi:FecR protein/RTX calcium-binding nonapeptide repeat (4 copies)